MPAKTTTPFLDSPLRENPVHPASNFDASQGKEIRHVEGFIDMKPCLFRASVMSQECFVPSPPNLPTRNPTQLKTPTVSTRPRHSFKRSGIQEPGARDTYFELHSDNRVLIFSTIFFSCTCSNMVRAVSLSLSVKVSRLLHTTKQEFGMTSKVVGLGSGGFGYTAQRLLHSGFRGLRDVGALALQLTSYKV